MTVYYAQLQQINAALVSLMAILDGQGGRGVELADAIDHLGAARELLGGEGVEYEYPEAALVKQIAAVVDAAEAENAEDSHRATQRDIEAYDQIRELLNDYEKGVVSADPNVNWRNDAIQFPRLIAEIMACVEITGWQWDTLAQSMDLSRDEVNQLFERAQAAWNRIKAATPRQS